MATKAVADLKSRSDVSWANLQKQLQGMEAHLDTSDAPGEWTTREVLSHLLFDEGWNPVDTLKTFSTGDLPVIEIVPGKTSMTDARRTMTLKQLTDTLDAQRRQVFSYLEGLSEADLGRQARIPLFKQIMGSDEVPIPAYIGALFEYHWIDHAGQLAKIRKAAGLPPVS